MIPLAARMRPSTLADVVGQDHLLGKGKPLAQVMENKQLHSMILWGPPGCGKTTLAKLLANHVSGHMETLSAVTSGVKDIRAVVERAEQLKHVQQTVLFVDEVHRFNKAQQDAFLPYVEDGLLIFIGATTENPSFALNNALLSRARVYVLKALDSDAIVSLLKRALTDSEKGLGKKGITLDQLLLQKIADYADGDARQALSLLEIISDFAECNSDGEQTLDEAVVKEVLQGSVRRFDKGGDVFYEQISALHKAVRGSSADGALYWFARMIDGGCDPLYIARRVLRMASEDIGNADPRGLSIALDAWQTYERLGSPEGELAIAQAIVYLAVAPKSNSVYCAYNEALADAKKSGSLEVPMHIRNAPTQLLKELGYGKDYRYAHDEADGYAAGESYLPEQLVGRQYYHPVNRGLEIKIKEKLAMLRQKDLQK